MLGDKDVIATVAVKDLAAARKFYEGTLGLKVTDASGSEAVTFASGRSKLMVYRSQYAGTNKATALNWNVGDGIDETVAALRERESPSSTTTFPARRGMATCTSWDP